jgi:hypothetical protein
MFFVQLYVSFVDRFPSHVDQAELRELLLPIQGADKMAEGCRDRTIYGDLLLNQPPGEVGQPFFSNVQRIKGCAIE